MNPLESRKQLLLAESELNRAQLSQEWQTVAHEMRNLAHRVKTIGAWASSAALLVAGIKAWRGGSPASAPTKSSWLQKILSGARVAWATWSAFRAHSQKEEPQ